MTASHGSGPANGAPRRLSADLLIGLSAATCGLVAMYFDHLAHGVLDWAGFAAGALVVLGGTALVFGRLVATRRTSPDHAGTTALLVGLLAVVSVRLTLWLGLSWVLAGGAIALGVDGRAGRHRGRALGGVGLGVLVLVACVAGTDWSNGD